MMKRFTALTFCAIFLISLFCGTAKAAVYSSDYLTNYDASLSAGTRSGELKVTFHAYARTSMSSVGISRIAVYTSDGTFVKSISGSTSNGLVASGTASHSGTYTIRATSGESYYLEVTFTARNSTGSDSKPFTTNTAAAK